MNRERIHRVQAALVQGQFDALVVRLPENVLFLSGFWPMCGWTFLVFTAGGDSTCILRSTEKGEAEDELWDAEIVDYPAATIDSPDSFGEIKKALQDISRGKNWKRVGYEGNFEPVAPPWNIGEPVVPASDTAALLSDVFNADRLVDATNLLNAMRGRKTPYEAEKLRRANEIACIGLQAFFDGVAPGVTGVELVAEVEHKILVQGTGMKGARRVRGFAQVATGAAETSIGYRPMEITTTRPLQEGDLALLELGTVADGYWSDRTRVRVAGEATARQLELHALVLEAQQKAFLGATVGAMTGDVDSAARSFLKTEGFGAEFVHVTGHGIGFRYHEPIPFISPGGKETLLEGMVHTVEPGIYSPEWGGIRIEDNVLITGSGPEKLGPFATDLSG